jgi:hypothetical protein
MYRRDAKEVAFFVVYIGEVHPSDAWQLPSNIKDRVVHASPTDLDERAALAGICVTRLGIKLPALIDGFDDATEKAYAGWPDRLYLIDRDGRIAYKNKPGPFGFKPEELEVTLRTHLPLAAPSLEFSRVVTARCGSAALSSTTPAERSAPIRARAERGGERREHGAAGGAVMFLWVIDHAELTAEQWRHDA